jgi:hypothetical protein
MAGRDGRDAAAPTVLLSLLGGLGLLLTLIGVFGMTAYAVRAADAGDRRAHGVRRQRTRRGAGDGARRGLAGGDWHGGGLAGAWGATRVISTFLFDTTPTMCRRSQRPRRCWHSRRSWPCGFRTSRSASSIPSRHFESEVTGGPPKNRSEQLISCMARWDMAGAQGAR